MFKVARCPGSCGLPFSTIKAMAGVVTCPALPGQLDILEDTKMTQPTLFDGIADSRTQAADIVSSSAQELITLAPIKEPDKVLFYDYLIHGPIEIGETLILYADGTFEKEGKNVRK